MDCAKCMEVIFKFARPTNFMVNILLKVSQAFCNRLKALIIHLYQYTSICTLPFQILDLRSTAKPTPIKSGKTQDNTYTCIYHCGSSKWSVRSSRIKSTSQPEPPCDGLAFLTGVSTSVMLQRQPLQTCAAHIILTVCFTTPNTL